LSTSLSLYHIPFFSVCDHLCKRRKLLGRSSLLSSPALQFSEYFSNHHGWNWNGEPILIISLPEKLWKSCACSWIWIVWVIYTACTCINEVSFRISEWSRRMKWLWHITHLI
jgi:hypothetical protein